MKATTEEIRLEYTRLIDKLILRLEISKEISRIVNEKMEAVKIKDYERAAKLQKKESELMTAAPEFDIDKLRELKNKF